MHPDLAREIIRQRAGEKRERAAKAGEARATRDAARSRRDQAAASRAIPSWRVPDYVDGTFHETVDRTHAH